MVGKRRRVTRHNLRPCVGLYPVWTIESRPLGLAARVAILV